MFLCLFSTATKANLIDVDINSDGTNQGYTLSLDNYNLTWMDFGIYKDISLTSMNETLNNSLIGWRYATYDETLFLFSMIFADYLTTPTSYNLLSTPKNLDAGIFSENITNITGSNHFDNYDNNYTFTLSEGGITDGSEIFASIIMAGFNSECTSCSTSGRFTDYYGETSDWDPWYGSSWMIVKESIDVAEPPSVIVFFIGLSGLLIIRLLKGDF